MTATRSSSLQRHGAAARRSEREEALERCDLCSAPIAPEHRHLLDLEHARADVRVPRRARCSSTARGGAGGGHYRLVPDRRLRIDDFELDDLAWEELRLPVEMAFFFRSSRGRARAGLLPEPDGGDRVAARPRGVAGARGRRTRCSTTLEPDVEALLVNRARGARQHLARARSTTATSSSA